MVASCMPRTGDLARSPGMCPNWESNCQTRRRALNPLSRPSQGKALTAYSLSGLGCVLLDLFGFPFLIYQVGIIIVLTLKG